MRADTLRVQIENAVAKLLVRYEIAQAASVVKRSATTLHAPASLAMRRAHAIPQVRGFISGKRRGVTARKLSRLPCLPVSIIDLTTCPMHLIAVFSWRGT